MIRPYTSDDFEKGATVVRALHGLKGFDSWAERIAKALAEEREIGICLGVWGRQVRGNM